MIAPGSVMRDHEHALEGALTALLADTIGLVDLTPGLRGFYLVAFEDGQRSRDVEVQQERDAADRLYGALCRRLPPPSMRQLPSELWRARGDHRRADLIDSELRRWLSGASE